MRVIGENGEQIGIISRDEALKKARDAGMDLVEVAPDAVPPVCRILDYGKFKYQLQKRHHTHHRTPTTKEIRLRLRTERHDMEIKAKKAKEFLERKDKVLISMRLWGRERAHMDMARDMMNDFAGLLGEMVRVEKPPSMEGSRRLTMVLAPAK